MGELARGPEAMAAPHLARDRWQDMYWNDAAQRGAARFEQAELCMDAPVASSLRVSPGSRPVVTVRPATVARARSSSRPVARRITSATPYAERGRQVQTETIARYLQVNNAVYGRLVPVRDLALPRQSYNAELQLWKGSEIGTPFVTGC